MTVDREKPAGARPRVDLGAVVEQHARRFLDRLGDRRMRVNALIDVVESRAHVNEECDPLDRARRLGPDDAQAEDLRRVAPREQPDDRAVGAGGASEVALELAR